MCACCPIRLDAGLSDLTSQPARGGFLACANLLLIFFSSADFGCYFLIQIFKIVYLFDYMIAKLLFKCFCFSCLFVFVFSLWSESGGLPAPAHFRSRPHPVFGSASLVILLLNTYVTQLCLIVLLNTYVTQKPFIVFPVSVTIVLDCFLVAIHFTGQFVCKLL